MCPSVKDEALFLGVLLTLTAFILITGCSENGDTFTDPAFRDWRLTLNGSHETELTLAELRHLPAIQGHGYCVSTTGFRFGPYRCRGVDLRDLTSLAGVLEPSSTVWVSAPDGYLWVFDSEQLDGRGFITFDENLSEIPSPPLRIILMYEQDGKPLSYNDGGPARIAIISEEPGVITEGSAWVKWVDRIEIREKGA